MNSYVGRILWRNGCSFEGEMYKSKPKSGVLTFMGVMYQIRQSYCKTIYHRYTGRTEILKDSFLYCYQLESGQFGKFDHLTGTVEVYP